MIRVFNYTWKVCKDLFSYYKSADVENVSQFKIRNELSKVTQLGAKKTKEQMQNELIDMLANYRSQCAKSTNPSQLVLPETLTLLPLYIHSILKNPAFKLLTATNLDLKIYWVQKLLSASIEEFHYIVYPRIYEVTDIGDEVSETDTFDLLDMRVRLQDASYGYTDEATGYLVKPMVIGCRQNKLKRDQLYLIDNGEYLTLLVNNKVPEHTMLDLFGYKDNQELAQDENLPAYVPAETDKASTLQQLME